MQGVLCYADQAVGIEVFFLSSHIKYFQVAASVILYLVTVYKYSRGKMHLITWRGKIVLNKFTGNNNQHLTRPERLLLCSESISP